MAQIKLESVATTEVVNPEGGTMFINTSDFDPAIHQLPSQLKKSESQTKKPTARKPAARTSKKQSSSQDKATGSQAETEAGKSTARKPKAKPADDASPKA